MHPLYGVWFGLRHVFRDVGVPVLYSMSMISDSCALFYKYPYPFRFVIGCNHIFRHFSLFVVCFVCFSDR